MLRFVFQASFLVLRTAHHESAGLYKAQHKFGGLVLAGPFVRRFGSGKEFHRIIRRLGAFGKVYYHVSDVVLIPLDGVDPYLEGVCVHVFQPAVGRRPDSGVLADAEDLAFRSLRGVLIEAQELRAFAFKRSFRRQSENLHSVQRSVKAHIVQRGPSGGIAYRIVYGDASVERPVLMNAHGRNVVVVGIRAHRAKRHDRQNGGASRAAAQQKRARDPNQQKAEGLRQYRNKAAERFRFHVGRYRFLQGVSFVLGKRSVFIRVIVPAHRAFRFVGSRVGKDLSGLLGVGSDLSLYHKRFHIAAGQSAAVIKLVRMQ